MCRRSARYSMSVAGRGKRGPPPGDGGHCGACDSPARSPSSQLSQLSDEALNLLVGIVGLAVVSPVVYVAEAPSPRDNRVVETSLHEHRLLLRCSVHAVVARVRRFERDDLTHVLAPPSFASDRRCFSLRRPSDIFF